MVTHDLEDAFSESDHIMVMADGVVKQIGNPKEVYMRPASSYVARFTGVVNLVPGPIHRDETGTIVLKNSFGEFRFSDKLYPKINGKFAYLVIRPHMIELTPKGKYHGRILKKKFYGSYYDLVLECLDQKRFTIRSAGNSKVNIGDNVSFDLLIDDIFLLSI